ncbi:MAG TPA: DnaB-like helicase C-terminal domain-containing protein, partial [Phycisphaerae bacterium]|nr:DnaB-like helicase C-terminal domain-containing protein [Phycisphaerae bacterium]
LAGEAVEDWTSTAEGRLADYDEAKAHPGGLTGVPTPWPGLNETTQGMNIGEFWIVVGRPGTGKCVDEDTEVYDPVTGCWRTIASAYREGGAVLSIDEETGAAVVSDPEFVDTGTKECLRAVVGSGREIVGTPEHPLLTPGGWRRLDEIRPGDMVACAARVPEPVAPVEMPEHEVDILAGMLAEGGTQHNTKSFANEDPEIIGVMRAAVGEMECDLVQYRGARRCEWNIVRRDRRRGVRNPVRVLLERHGVYGLKSKDRFVPDAVFSLPDRQLARFLGLFFSCDGCVEERQGDLTVGLASERMVRQIADLFLRFGVVGRVRRKECRRDGKVFPSWDFRVRAESYDNFKRSIPLFGPKRGRLERHPGTRNPNGDVVVVEPEALAGIVNRFKESGGRLVDVGRRLGWSSKFYAGSMVGVRDRVSRGMLRALREERDPGGVDILCSEDIFWDEVVSVEAVGERRVYDACCPRHHNFLANGIYAHNTWHLAKMAVEAWLAGKRVLFVTLEMTPKRIGRRLDAVWTRAPFGSLKRGTLGMHMEQPYRDAMKQLAGSPPLHVVGRRRAKTVADVGMLIGEYRPDVVLIDGIYKLRPSGAGSKNRPNWEKVMDLVDEVQELSQDKTVPIVGTTQFNRQAAKTGKNVGKAGIEDMAFADAIAMNADVVLALLSTPQLRATSEIILRLLKNRDDEVKAWTSKFDLENMDFDETGVWDDGETGAPGGVDSAAADADY